MGTKPSALSEQARHAQNRHCTSHEKVLLQWHPSLLPITFDINQIHYTSALFYLSPLEINTVTGWCYFQLLWCHYTLWILHPGNAIVLFYFIFFLEQIMCFSISVLLHNITLTISVCRANISRILTVGYQLYIDYRKLFRNKSQTSVLTFNLRHVIMPARKITPVLIPFHSLDIFWGQNMLLKVEKIKLFYCCMWERWFVPV